MAQPCSQSFAINVIGGDTPCTIEIDSDDLDLSFDVADVADGKSVPIGFTYTVGAPRRTVFASSYSSSRTGGSSGSPPDLAGRSFNKTPGMSLGASEEDNAVLTVDIASYGGTETTNLGDGMDTYDITIWMRESTVRIGGNSPPSNLEPANPN